MSTSNITFYEASKLGKGLPFAIVPHPELVANNDLYAPSLRDFHVVFWFKKGSGRYFIDFKEYTIEPGSLILVSKDHLHYFEPFQESCALQSIVFSPAFLYRNDSDLKHLFTFDAGCHYAGLQVLKVRPADVSFLEEISRQMLEVYRHWEGPEQNEAFYHLLCLFLIKAGQLQQPQEENPQLAGEHSKLLLAFNALLEQHFREQARVDFYVEQLGVTAKLLARVVKEQYKVTTKTVIDERRVLEMKRELRGTTKAVKEIAYDMGFDEPTNMVKYFKKQAGETPNGFRSAGQRV